ncbi:hypothetical protein AB0O75_45225 [Streptomyces sp. NPDC088921]|uniref:hypothetical protein n=1 Tax=unclassified Streptomyces TaxID=2593676 RepID=UPI0034411185
MIDGHCVISPFVRGVHATLNGQDSPALRAVLDFSRSPIPGLMKVGTWLSRGQRAYVVAHRRPALVLRMTGLRYDVVVLDHICGRPR